MVGLFRASLLQAFDETAACWQYGQVCSLNQGADAASVAHAATTEARVRRKEGMCLYAPRLLPLPEPKQLGQGAL